MLELKGPINPISVIGDFQDFGYGPGLEFKKRGGYPIYLAKVLEAGNSISVIGQEGIISGKPTSRNPKNPVPIFGNRLIPHRVTRGRTNGRAKIGVRFNYLKIRPFGNVNKQPLLNCFLIFFKVFECSGDDGALFEVKG